MLRQQFSTLWNQLASFAGRILSSAAIRIYKMRNTRGESKSDHVDGHDPSDTQCKIRESSDLINSSPDCSATLMTNGSNANMDKEPDVPASNVNDQDVPVSDVDETSSPAYDSGVQGVVASGVDVQDLPISDVDQSSSPACDTDNQGVIASEAGDKDAPVSYIDGSDSLIDIAKQEETIVTIGIDALEERLTESNDPLDSQLDETPMDSDCQTKMSEPDLSHLDRPIASRNIGGRRNRIHVAQNTVQKPPTRRLPVIKCGLNDEENKWELILNDGDTSTCARVHIDNQTYKIQGGRFVIPSISKEILVESDDGQTGVIDFYKEKPMIFKMKKHWEGEGPMVSSLCRGHYTIIARRDASVAGHAPVESEICKYPDFIAHFRYIDADTPWEDYAEYRDIGIEAGQSHMNLTGKQSYDDSTDGALFCGEVPMLECSSDIDNVRVGDEAVKGWTEEFNPKETNLREVVGERVGWFFLRGYSKGTMVDSESFRYIRELEEIRVDGKEYLGNTVIQPTPNGYKEAHVEIVGVKPTSLALECCGAGVRMDADKAVIHVTGEYGSDDFVVCYGEGNGKAAVRLRLPRLWWRLVGSKDTKEPWSGEPLTMTRANFEALSEKEYVLQLHMRNEGTAKERTVQAGFGCNSTKEYSRKKDSNIIDVPLFEFLFHDAVREETAQEINFSVVYSGASFPIILIPPERRRSDSVQERSHKGIAIRAKGDLTVPLVRKACGWRKGRGFSLPELAEIDMSTKDAIHRRLRVDIRRRTCHSVNLSVLKDRINA